jgi:medium-chain acyl-[acyl-carrier-protein] hydrolase
VSAASGEPARMLICKKPNPAARVRLYCFPFAGGGLAAFTSWMDEMPADVGEKTEIWTISLPGRESRRIQSRFTQMPPIVQALTEAIASCLAMPFVFFGHSMGALISYELACELRSRGLTGPLQLIVSAHRAPHLPDRHPMVHDLPDAEILAKVRRLGGTPEEVLDSSEIMELFLPVLRADFTVCETYVYQDREPLDCPITAFGGNDDPQVSRSELAGWQARTRKPFVLHMFPGDHFFLQSCESLVLNVLAHDLRQVLRRLPDPGTRS